MKKIMLCIMLLLLIPLVSADYYNCISKYECIDADLAQAAQAQDKERFNMLEGLAIVTGLFIIADVLKNRRKRK